MEYDVEAEKAVEYLWLGSRPVARIDISYLCTEDKDMDGDVDGHDLASSLTGSPDIAALAEHFGNTANPGQTESVYFYHTDHLGTPQVITDSVGSVVWKADYLPFGKTVIQSLSSIENNLRFPGLYYDEETGLHYNWHRYYDPETGRYLTPDPIGLDGGINLYVYASVNPTNVIDPRGLKTIFSVKMGALLIGGIGGIVGHATAVSDCVNGKRYIATYNVWGGTLGAGMNIRGLKNIIPWLTKNLTSASLGKTFEIAPNYPPHTVSWLDAEGPSASLLYGATIIDMEVSPHEGGRGKRSDVKIVSYGFSGDIGIQLSSVSGITLIRNMIRQEDCCEQK